MMKTLLFNAKLKFMTDGDSSSIELCDSYQSFIDLLSLFVSSNSADIPSIQQLSNTDLARWALNGGYSIYEDIFQSY